MPADPQTAAPDLVRRLRKQKFAQQVGEPCAHYIDAYDAANEIERLRAIVSLVAKTCGQGHCNCIGSTKVKEALKYQLPRLLISDPNAFSARVKRGIEMRRRAGK